MFFIYFISKFTTIIDSSSVSFERSSPSTASSLDTSTKTRHQSLYDAVTGQSCEDRFLSKSKVNTRTGKPISRRAVPPERVLANRWNRQVKECDVGDKDNEVDDVKLTEAGLVVPSQRENALPGSVFFPT